MIIFNLLKYTRPSLTFQNDRSYKDKLYNTKFSYKIWHLKKTFAFHVSNEIEFLFFIFKNYVFQESCFLGIIICGSVTNIFGMCKNIENVIMKKKWTWCLWSISKRFQVHIE